MMYVQKIIPSKFKIILKRVMRLRNKMPQMLRGSICRLHKHGVYSAEHNAINDYFFNVQIQANVKKIKITPLYNLSPLITSPILVLLDFRGWHVFCGGLAHVPLNDSNVLKICFSVMRNGNTVLRLKMVTFDPE